MSYGDEIMAGGQALSLYRRTGKCVRILDKEGSQRWDPLWHGLPWIVRPDEIDPASVELVNGVGARPYLDYSQWRHERMTYTSWRACDHVGEIRFTKEERKFAEEMTSTLGRFILIEPNIQKASKKNRWDSNPNKQWGRDNWRELVRLLGDFPIVQVGDKDVDRLEGAKFIVTPSFRLGAAVLQRAALAILPESGLQHAAAALGKRSIVLFGGVSSVENVGYPLHVNIVRGEPCCTIHVSCPHCAEIWQSISAQEIAAEARALLRAPNSG